MSDMPNPMNPFEAAAKLGRFAGGLGSSIKPETVDTETTPEKAKAWLKVYEDIKSKVKTGGSIPPDIQGMVEEMTRIAGIPTAVDTYEKENKVEPSTIPGRAVAIGTERARRRGGATEVGETLRSWQEGGLARGHGIKSEWEMAERAAQQEEIKETPKREYAEGKEKIRKEEERRKAAFDNLYKTYDSLQKEASALGAKKPTVTGIADPTAKAREDLDERMFVTARQVTLLIAKKRRLNLKDKKQKAEAVRLAQEALRTGVEPE